MSKVIIAVVLAVALTAAITLSLGRTIRRRRTSVVRNPEGLWISEGSRFDLSCLQGVRRNDKACE